MKFKILILTLIFAFGVEFVAAQKNKRIVDDAAAPPPPKTVSKNNIPVAVPRKDFAFVVNIDGERKVSLSIQTAESDEFLADKTQTKNLSDFFGNLNERQNQKTAKNSSEPLLIIKAEPNLKFNQIVEVINAARISPTQKTKIQISEYLNVFIPTKAEIAEEKSSNRPNPLSLIVNLDTDLNLMLNSENEGSLNDSSQLEKHLAQIFKERESNGVFRVGANEVEKTVFIKVSPSANFADVVKVAKALRTSGADLIGLKIEDLPK